MAGFKQIKADCVYENSISDVGGSIVVKYNTEQIAVADIHVHNKYIKIKKLVVENDFRGLGIGKALMQYIVDWCVSEKIYAATVQACTNISQEMIDMNICNGIPQNKLKDFYRSYGFTDERGDFLHLDFGVKKVFKPKDVFWQKAENIL